MNEVERLLCEHGACRERSRGGGGALDGESFSRKGVAERVGKAASQVPETVAGFVFDRGRHLVSGKWLF